MIRSHHKKSHGGHEKHKSTDSVPAIMKDSPDLIEIHECRSQKKPATCFHHNKSFDRRSIVIIPGDFIVTADDVILQTVLGSCVSVCLYSDESSYCGMNHFMLPRVGKKYRKEGNIMFTDAAFYGINAMEMMINAMLKLGVNKNSLKAKVFGGGAVLPIGTPGKRIGDQNIEFVLRYLNTEEIPVVACSLGGNYGRKILFFTKTKEILLSRLGERTEKIAVNEEKMLLREQEKRLRDITIFNDKL